MSKPRVSDVPTTAMNNNRVAEYIRSSSAGANANNVLLYRITTKEGVYGAKWEKGMSSNELESLTASEKALVNVSKTKDFNIPSDKAKGEIIDIKLQTTKIKNKK